VHLQRLQDYLVDHFSNQRIIINILFAPVFTCIPQKTVYYDKSSVRSPLKYIDNKTF